MDMGLDDLQSGYPEHARNRPKRPRLTSIGLLHLSHFSSVVSSCTTTIFPSTSLKSRVLLQSGYPLQARNRPIFPHLMTMGFLAHLSQVRSVGISSRFTSRMAI